MCIFLWNCFTSLLSSSFRQWWRWAVLRYPTVQLLQSLRVLARLMNFDSVGAWMLPTHYWFSSNMPRHNITNPSLYRWGDVSFLTHRHTLIWVCAASVMLIHDSLTDQRPRLSQFRGQLDERDDPPTGSDALSLITDHLTHLLYDTIKYEDLFVHQFHHISELQMTMFKSKLLVKHWKLKNSLLGQTSQWNEHFPFGERWVMLSNFTITLRLNNLFVGVIVVSDS